VSGTCAGSRWKLAAAGAAVALALGGCAATGTRGGVFETARYRITVPPAGWRVVRDAPADLQLSREGAPGGMLVHASCGTAARREVDALTRRLLSGLPERRILERAAVTVNGHEGERALFEGAGAEGPVRGESYVVKDAECVYDLLYVSTPEAFEGGRADFTRFVESLVNRAGGRGR
jgi:hypothetical protein